MRTKLGDRASHGVGRADDPFRVLEPGVVADDHPAALAADIDLAERGRSPGCIGVQVYAGSTIAWRHIRIKP